MSCGSCNKPSIYRTPQSGSSAVQCRSDACGLNKTNDLGYILRDHAFSVVQAQTIVQQDAGEPGCPIETEACLRLPCDVIQGETKFVTPLVLPDGTPFYLEPGDVVQKIVIAKNAGELLDEQTTFILGTLGCNCDTTDATRFIPCEQPLTGCILNQVCAVRIKEVSVELCQGVVDYCNSERLGCTDPCSNLAATSGGCSAGATAAEGYSFWTGERNRAMIGLTVLCGALAARQIRVFIQVLRVKCSDASEVCQPCFN